jgi:hypothetical protein
MRNLKKGSLLNWFLFRVKSFTYFLLLFIKNKNKELAKEKRKEKKKKDKFRDHLVGEDVSLRSHSFRDCSTFN